MYLPIHHTPASDLAGGGFASSPDGRVLSRFWHPVAWSSAVTDQPVASRLLGVDLVVYRTVDGIGVARNACPHRGASLSMGWLDAERSALVCPMHGHHYASDGRCTRIPSMDDDSGRIPPRMRLHGVQSAERYGIVWACLAEEPLRPLPHWPELDAVTAPWVRVDIPKGRWQAAASRHCENFNDVAHLSWVHMKTFGNRDKPVIGHHEVERTGHGLRMSLSYMEMERGFNDNFVGERETHYIYDLCYPFASHLRSDYGPALTSHYFDIASPVDETACEIYQITLSNVPGAAQSYTAYQETTNEEDRLLVESQLPRQVPLNAGYEVSVPSDKFSMQYRRDLVQLFGLGAGEAA